MQSVNTTNHPNYPKRRVAPRNGDRRQARRRVQYLCECGVLPWPDEVPCVDCGHKRDRRSKDDRRHEYDHRAGYGPDAHEVVESVCSRCHYERSNRRGERARPSHTPATTKPATVWASRNASRSRRRDEPEVSNKARMVVT